MMSHFVPANYFSDAVVRAYVCVCVCVRERERERERDVSCLLGSLFLDWLVIVVVI